MGNLLLMGAGGFAALGFNPTSIPDMKLWLKADRGLTLVGSNVSQWDDQSGNNNHAVQATAASRPLYVENSINGTKPSIQFDGVDDFFNLTNLIGHISNPLPFTVLVVMKRRVDTNQGYLGHTGGGTYFLQRPTVWWCHNVQLTSGAAMVNDVWYSRTNVVTANTNVKYYSNGALIGTTAGTATTSINWVGHGFSDYLDGKFAEVLIYQRVLDSTELSNLNAYINTEYGI